MKEIPVGNIPSNQGNDFSYDAWFIQQVQASLEDSRPSVSDEEAKQYFADKRALMRSRVSQE